MTREFAYAAGGELPLSPDEAKLWLDQDPGDDAVDHACRLFAGADGDALWLRYGRSAFGAALEMAGVGADTPVAMPAYQCGVIFAKAGATSGRLTYYQLDDGLAPEPDCILDAAGRAGAVMTCSYFGSAAVDLALASLGPQLLDLANRPWVIEDRALAFPAPVDATDAARRCDFILYSLRKCYPVPDGAPLIACSERAREAMAKWRQKHREYALGGAPDPALENKVRTKIKRYQWLSNRPIVDDEAHNARAESVASEDLIDHAADANGADATRGSRATAAYMLGRDLTADRQAVDARARKLVEALASRIEANFPLPDCVGIAVPLLVKRRTPFLESLRQEGLFLPAHWPKEDAIDAGATAGRWYDGEVSLPTLPASPGQDIDFMIEKLDR